MSWFALSKKSALRVCMWDEDIFPNAVVLLSVVRKWSVHVTRLVALLQDESLFTARFRVARSADTNLQCIHVVTFA